MAAGGTNMVEQLYTQWLSEADIDFLTALCEEYKIVVPATKVGKKEHLLKLIMRYLYSEDLENSVDGGKDVFYKLLNDLGESLGKDAKLKQKDGDNMPPFEEVPDEDVNGAEVEPKQKLSYHKLRGFQINGTIGNVGQKET